MSSKLCRFPFLPVFTDADDYRNSDPCDGRDCCDQSLVRVLEQSWLINAQVKLGYKDYSCNESTFKTNKKVKTDKLLK